MKPILIRCAAAVALLFSTGQATGATGVADDFESYTLSTFPVALWLDAGTLDPQPPLPPSPSAVVVETADAFDTSTRALSVVDAVTRITGIYQRIPVSPFYSLTADIRIDRFSDNALRPTSDWAMQLTLAQTIRNLSTAPQIGIYASSLTEGWRMILIEDVSSFFVDIDLGVAASLDTWYRVSLDLDATTGGHRTRITDIATSTLLVDYVDTFVGWTSGNGQYDAVAFIDGEDPSNPAVTLSNLAVVDNINVTAVPEPTTAALVAVGLLVLVTMRLGSSSSAARVQA